MLELLICILLLVIFWRVFLAAGLVAFGTVALVVLLVALTTPEPRNSGEVPNIVRVVPRG